MSINQISDLLLKNIEEEITLIIKKGKQFSFNSFIRGCHAYMEISTPKVGDDSLYLKCVDGNEHDKYPVAVIIEEQTGGHIPRNLCKIFRLFCTLPIVKSLESV